jgi:uncharacterized protein (TIGR01244 family)
MLRQLDDKTLVSGQITPAEVPGLKQRGVTMIVNNRPDDEDAGQPLAADIEAAAEQAGIAYRFIPIARGIGPADVDAMRGAMRECGDGKLLAFCRSGNRSALVWAVARAGDGVPRGELDRSAAEAGIDLSPVAHLL